MTPATRLRETLRSCQTYPIMSHASRRPRTIRDRQVPLFSPSEFSFTHPIVMELINLFARDGPRYEQPVRRRNIGLRGRTIRSRLGAGQPSLALRSWAMSRISLRFTGRVGLRCARFGPE